MSKNKCKPLWMPLYVSKFLADTAHLSAHQCGAYINMLCAMWRSDDGTLLNDEKLLMKVGKVHPPHWRQTWKAIGSLFDIDGERLTNTDLQAELGKANAKIVLKRAAASLGGQTAQFKRTALSMHCKESKTPSNALKNNNGAQANAQASAQHNHNKNITDSGEGSPSPLPRMGKASGAPNNPTNSPPGETQKWVYREEVVEPPISPTNSAPTENHSRLNQAIANFGEAFRHKNGGCQ